MDGATFYLYGIVSGSFWALVIVVSCPPLFVAMFAAVAFLGASVGYGVATLDEALAMVDDGRIRDAKTVIGILLTDRRLRAGGVVVRQCAVLEEGAALRDARDRRPAAAAGISLAAGGSNQFRSRVVSLSSPPETQARPADQSLDALRASAGDNQGDGTGVLLGVFSLLVSLGLLLAS